jgi:hypothetical protein
MTMPAVFNKKYSVSATLCLPRTKIGRFNDVFQTMFETCSSGNIADHGRKLCQEGEEGRPWHL